jgi:hypothetical protein
VTIKKSRPGIATAARVRSRAAGSSVVKSAAKKPKPQPAKEYSFPVEAWPAVATAVAVAVLVALLIFA